MTETPEIVRDRIGAALINLGIGAVVAVTRKSVAAYWLPQDAAALASRLEQAAQDRAAVERVEVALQQAVEHWPEGYEDPWGEIVPVQVSVNHVRRALRPLVEQRRNAAARSLA